MPIRKPIKQLGKDTGIYGIGHLVSKLAVFLLIPIYTRYLSTIEVGLLALLEMVEMFLLAIAPMGIINAIWRQLPEQDQIGKKRVVFTAFLGMMILDAILIIICSIFYKSIAGFFGFTESSTELLLVVFINILLAIGTQFLLYNWQYHHKSLAYLTLSLCQFIGTLLVTISFVVFQGWGLWGVVLAKTTVLGLLFIFSTVIIIYQNWIVPSFSLFIKLLKYGAPLIVFALIMPVLTLSDRFFLRIFISLEDIGIYSIAYKFGMLINILLVVPFQRGWSPLMYQLGVEEKFSSLFKDIMFYFSVIGSVIFLAVSLFAANIIEIVATPEYIAGASIVPIIALAYFINGFRLIFMAGAALKDKTQQLGMVAFVGILINLILNYLLIKNFGVMGAAWSTLLSYFAITFFVYRVSQKIVYINWSWKRIVKLSVILFIIFVLVIHLQGQFETWALLFGFTGILIFILLLWISKTITQREINGIKSLLNSLRQ